MGKVQQHMVMKLPPQTLTLLEWYNWLTSCGLVLGKDYRWAWCDDTMAVEFLDTDIELIVRLKMHD